MSSIAQDGNPISQFEDLLQTVTHKQNRDTALAKLLRDDKKLLYFVSRERSRWFVHDQDTCIQGKRFGNFDQLLISHRKTLPRGVHTQGNIE